MADPTIPEDPACPGTRHGSFNAVRRYRCVCPTIRAAYLAREAERVRAFRRRYRKEVPYWRDSVSPATVLNAKAGLLPPDELTPAERYLVVTHLRAVKGLTLQKIADTLNWSGGGQRGRWAVSRYCSRQNIHRPTASRPQRPRDLVAAA
jgi:hypothetical protein